MRVVIRAWTPVAAVLLASCFSDGGVGSASSAASSGDASSTTSAGTMTASPTSGAMTVGATGMGTSGTTDGTAGTGSETPPRPGPLVDEGLLVRYFIDEAGDGQPPAGELIDAAPMAPAEPLVLAYQTSPQQPIYAGPLGKRGLQWNLAGANGVATRPIGAGDKLRALDGSTEATVEVLVDLQGVSLNGSRVVHLGGPESNGMVAIRPETDGEIVVTIGVTLATRFDVRFSNNGPMVLHAVFDSNAPSGQRVALYVDGVIQNPASGDPIPAAAQLVLLPGDELSLGNRADGSRSFDGTLRYAAVYAVALEESQVGTNAMLLRINDDT